jgi:DNA primase small subunit
MDVVCTEKQTQIAVVKNYFANREFSFTLASDTYIRFRSFTNDQDLKTEIVRLAPVKIDIGAVYNFPVRVLRLVKN